MPSNDPDIARDVVEAVLAVPDVVAMSENPEPGTAPPTDPATTWLHVTVSDAHAPATTAENVQQAAHLITGGPVNVTVEEIVAGPATPHVDC